MRNARVLTQYDIEHDKEYAVSVTPDHKGFHVINNGASSGQSAMKTVIKISISPQQTEIRSPGS